MALRGGRGVKRSVVQTPLAVVLTPKVRKVFLTPKEAGDPEIENVVTQLQTALNVAQEENRTLKDKLAVAETRCDKLLDRIAGIEDKHERLRKKQVDLEKEERQLRDRLAEGDKLSRSRQGEAQALREANSRVYALEEIIKSLEKTNEQLVAENEKVFEKVNTLRRLEEQSGEEPSEEFPSPVVKAEPGASIQRDDVAVAPSSAPGIDDGDEAVLMGRPSSRRAMPPSRRRSNRPTKEF